MNTIKLYDTWNKTNFIINNKKSLRIYICGPTVYTHTHIGHLKTYMTFDIIRRVLEDHFKISVQYMMNITNVDDKIIKKTYQKEYGEAVDLETLEEKNFLENHKFIDYANYWEQNFFDVLDEMKIKRPNIVSRVTEYIDEIFEFVDKIDANGFAFEHKGSVYFYGTKYNNILEEGEHEYSKDSSNPHNFVLLKKIKPHEPGWDSKWGSVRPGWHIECSAMASSVFGSNFDIHGGGIDLKFPHHHNEMLQSNARFHAGTEKEWVDHFMHTGHLNIEGLKMSRSLKNFITAKEIAKKYSHNELRMLFLLHNWSDAMDYSNDTMHHATYYTDYFSNFFTQASSIALRPNTKRYKKFGPTELAQMEMLEKTKLTVEMELRNNINTPDVIKSLQHRVSEMFIYVTKMDTCKENISEQIVNNTVVYVRSILTMFGLEYESNGLGKEDQLLKVISDVRMELRNISGNIAKKVKPFDKKLAKELSGSLYELTDKVRDVMLPEIDIHLTDK